VVRSTTRSVTRWVAGATGRVDGAELRRDHLPEVEPDLLEVPCAVQAPLERLAPRQLQHGLAPRLPAQRVRRGLPGRERGEHERAPRGLHAERRDRPARMPVLERPEVVAPGLLVAVQDARLREPPEGREARDLLVVGQYGMRLAHGDGLEARLAPAALEHADLVTSADALAHLAAVGVDDHVVGDRLAEAPVPARRRDEARRVRLQRRDVRRVQEDQPLRLDVSELDGHRTLVHQQRSPDLERDPPGGAAPRRRARRRCAHGLGDLRAAQRLDARVAPEGDRLEERRGGSIVAARHASSFRRAV
jgi:hypothetical protein